MIEVLAALIVKDSKLLLARRAPTKHLSGFWEFPGGKLEAGENDQDCLKREIKEELGVSIEVVSHFMNNHHIYNDKGILLKSYICKTNTTNKISLKDHDSVEWVHVNDLLDYKLAPADIPIAKKLIDERNNL